MSDRARTLWFGALALGATLSIFATFGLPIALAVMVVLMRAWSQRAEFVGQDRAAQLLAAAMLSLGLGGLAVTVGADAAVVADRGAAQLIAVLGLAANLGALGLAVAACDRLARARGRNRAWAAAGLATVIGFGVLLFLPPARR